MDSIIEQLTIEEARAVGKRFDQPAKQPPADFKDGATHMIKHEQKPRSDSYIRWATIHTTAF